MSKQIQYTDEPIGDTKLVAGFLPSPSELKLKNNSTKVTITLSADSVVKGERLKVEKFGAFF